MIACSPSSSNIRAVASSALKIGSKDNKDQSVLLLKGREIAKRLTELLGLEHASHDLAAPGLGKGVDELDLSRVCVRREPCLDEVRYLVLQLL